MISGYALASLGSVFDASPGGASIPAEVRSRAYARAVAVMESGPAASCGPIAMLGFATEMFLAAAVELAADPVQQTELVERIERVSGISRLALGCEVLGAPRLLQLPAAVASEVTLKLLVGFAGLERAAVFARTGEGELRVLAWVGPPGVGIFSGYARALLADDGSARGRRGRGMAGTRLELGRWPASAVVARGPGVDSPECEPLLAAAAPLLAAVIERDELLTRERQGGNADAVERRLARLRFDLHDGPQQDVIMLADDLRLFASQFASVYGDSEHADNVRGRLEDLQARLVTIDGDLRRIAAFVQSPFLQAEPLPEALAQVVDKFMERSDVEPTVELRGEFDGLTDSQQITLLGLIREALSNIREHSEAKKVTIAVSAGPTGVNASVTDDGRGFDPETTLVRAARSGHLGLVGMHERVRMLGGNTQIDSRPGGPTVISVSLPPQPGRQNSDPA